MEQTQLRMNEAVNNLIDELDKTYLRDIQKKMFNCSAECCNDKIGPRESIEQCVERCNGPMKSAQKSLEREIGALQDQLSRCSMTCYDKLIQKMGPDPNKYSDSQLAAFNDKLNSCVSVCANDHLKLLPQIKDRLVKSLR